MAENNQGVFETMTGAISKAVEKLSSRKVGIALVGMWLMGSATTPESQKLIFWLCIAALSAQLIQDVVEVLRTGKDLPDGNGNGKVLLEDPSPKTDVPIDTPPSEGVR